MSNLYAASSQWSSRPADERFESLESMLAFSRYHRETAREKSFKLNELRVMPQAGNMVLVGPEGGTARLTHYCFGQLSARVGAPAGYLRNLPIGLAAANLECGLRLQDNDTIGVGLFHKNGENVVRAVTSEKYTRIWNADIIERLISLKEMGWRVPPARPAYEGQPGSRRATEADVLPGAAWDLSVKVGDWIAPAGLYASDHDMFAFMVDENARINDGSGEGLARGFFVSNSEVGAASLKLTRFMYRRVCGNHIVWGAKNVSELKIVHRGAADGRFQREVVAELRKYSNESASEDEQRIVAAKRCILGTTKDEVLDMLFGKRIASRKVLELAYSVAEMEEAEHAAGSPRSAWGYANGLTRLSQTDSGAMYADDRMELDRAAGKVLDLVF